MRRTSSIFLGALSVGMFLTAHLALAGTGFVTSPLWLSPESPKEGDMTTLSVAFRNADTDTLTGSILFYDGDTLLAKKPITIPGNQIGTATVTFKMLAGDHSFSASMTTANKLKSSGTVETITLPDARVTLPDQFVSKKINLAAQAEGTATAGSQAPILNQIDKAEQKVLDAIPEGTKESISKVADSIEAWRAEKAEALTTTATESKQVIAAAKAETPVSTVKTSTDSTKVVITKEQKAHTAGPLDYIKLWGSTILGYLFRATILFYAVLILLSYFILRFIWRRIVRLFRKGKGAPAKSEH